jgi:hypothetical protein
VHVLGASYDRKTVPSIGSYRLATVTLSLAVFLSAGDRKVPSLANAQVLTVCQALSDRAMYSGQTVIIVGRSVSTGEGSWIDQTCEMRLVVEGKSFSPVISTSYSVADVSPPPEQPKGFKWDQRALKRALADVRKTTVLEGNSDWCALYGRLETAIPVKLSSRNGQILIRTGYGHLNSAPAELVWDTKHGFLKLKFK